MALKNRRYPHLLPAEIPLWETWLASNPGRFASYAYDVHVGMEPGTRPDLSYIENRLRSHLCRRRIDVVARNGDDITIIEIKPVIDLKAIGQACAYPILYALDHQSTIIPSVLLIAAAIESNTQPVLTALAIPFELVATPHKPPGIPNVWQ